MRPLLFIFLFFGLVTLATGQSCRSQNWATERLNVNAVDALILNGGDLWWDSQRGRYLVTNPNTTVPNDSSTSLFTGGLAMAGRFKDGTIRYAAQRYGRGTNDFDFYAGPIIPGVEASDYCLDWEIVFPITRVETNAFLAAYDAGINGVSEIPEHILGWPGVGNPYFSQVHDFSMPAAATELAPFVDRNNDGIYDPLVGDYPAFLGDKAIWTVFHDIGTHRETATTAILNVEIHQLAYAFIGTGDDPLNLTTFYDYQFYNRGESDISDYVVGQMIDYEMGCSGNEAFATVPDKSLFYTFHKAGRDTVTCRSDQFYSGRNPINVFQILESNSLNVSATGSKLLSTSAIHPEPLNTLTSPMAPFSTTALFNILNGYWRNGEVITRGGFGYAEGGDTTRYMFDGGEMENGMLWMDCNSTREEVYHRLHYGTGPYDLSPGDHASYTLAVTSVFGSEFDGECPNPELVLQANVRVAEFYESERERLNELVSNSYIVDAKMVIKVSPNPCTNHLLLSSPGNSIIRQVDILGMDGRIIKSVATNAQKISIDLSETGMVSGLYFYRVTMANGKTGTGKFVKAK